MVWLVGIIAILIGLAVCFWGYRLFRFWLAFAGFLLGTAIGFFIGLLLLGPGVWPIVIALVLGIIVALLAFFLYKVGAILTGIFLGALLSGMIFGAFGIAPVWWVYLIGAIIGGVLAGIFVKHYIIIGSSFNGAYLTVLGIFSLIQGQNLLNMQENMLLPHDRFPWYIYVGILVLAIVGAVVQYRRYRGRSVDDMLQKK